jgi:PhzF family phenazine biosynthesis protein
MLYDFMQVDVFTQKPLYGNPAAVVFDADDLATETMQRIAREMNLSETVFILAPMTKDADYRARIFTPVREMPFAGHPTLAAAHAMLSRHPGNLTKNLLRQECGIGIVQVEVLPFDKGRLLRMTQGDPTFRESDLSRVTVAKMLGCTEFDFATTAFEVVSTGVPWLIVELSCSDVISTLNPDQKAIADECKALGACGVTVFAEHHKVDAVRIRVRTFAPGEGVTEDPVCGSGNGSVAAFIARHKHWGETQGSYVAEQGIEIGRDGEVYTSWKREGGCLQVLVGGTAVTSASGQLHL